MMFARYLVERVCSCLVDVCAHVVPNLLCAATGALRQSNKLTRST